MKILTSHNVGAAECASFAARSGGIATAVNAALSAGIRDTVRPTQPHQSTGLHLS